MCSKAEFHTAVATLIGAELHAKMSDHGYNPADFCREVAQRAFVGKLDSIDQGAFEVVRATALRLWAGDGCTGLTD